MRLLIASSTFPLEVDGSLPRFVYDLAEALSDHCEVTALVPDAPGVPRREQMGRVAVRRFTYSLPRSSQALAYRNGMYDNLRRSLRARLQVLPYISCQIKALRRQIREQRIDIVNSHWMVPQSLSVALAGNISQRIPHVISVHAADVYLMNRLTGGRSLTNFITRRSDAIFADGSHVRRQLDALAGRSTGTIVQPMGCSIATFRDASDRELSKLPFEDGFLLYFGRLAEKKGVTYLLRAMPSILSRQPRLGLVIVGYGSLEEELRYEASQLGISRSVAFVGQKKHSEIASYLQQSRLAVIPSIVDRNGEADGMPTVVIEAMASGTRVVASAVDGIPDIVRNRENGWLCRQKDPADLAEKVLTALDDRSPSTVVSAARATADRLDWKEVAERYARTFERLLADRDAKV